MLVPKLRFKEFTNEWETKKIHDISDIVGGGTPSKNVEQYWNGNIAWISSSDIKENDIFNINITRYINEYAIKKSATKLCPKGTINIVSRVGVGKVAISPINLCTSQDFANLINLTCNNIFLAYNLSIIMLEKSNQTQGTSIKGITIDEIKNISINLPSIEEQTKISNFLSLIDKKIELQQKLVDNLNLYKKGLLKKVFSNNQGWKTVKIKDIFQISRGVIIPKKELSMVQDNEYKYPVYSSQTSNNGVLGYSKTFDFNGNYLTWTTDGANAGTVFFRTGKFRCTNVCGLLYDKTNLFNNVTIKEILQLETPKHVSYVGNPKLMNNIMGDIDIKIPSIEEQNRIADLFTNLDKKIDLETNKLKNLKEYKKGLLQKMFI